MYLVFNCGATHTRVGVSADGQALVRQADFPTNQDFDKQMSALAEVANNLLGKNRVDKIAGGVAGVWQLDKSKLFWSPNLRDWEGRPIKKRLEEKFGVTAVLGNDVEMEGLGEATVGAGRRKRIVAYLAVGTGIGGVKVEDGKICARVYGFEPGHQIIETNREVGFLENFAGGAAMEKIYGRPPAEIDDADAWEKETQLVAVGVHNAILFWSPEVVILGGSLMRKIKLDDLKTKLSAQMKMLPTLPEVVAAELKEKAGLYGALAVLHSPSG